MCPRTSAPQFSLLELKLHLVWAQPPETGIQAGSLGALVPGLVLVPLSDFAAKCLVPLLVPLLVIQIISSGVFFYHTSPSFCLYGFYPYPSFMQNYINAVCLSLRKYVAVCLQTVGIAHVFKYRLDFPRF